MEHSYKNMKYFVCYTATVKMYIEIRAKEYGKANCLRYQRGPLDYSIWLRDSAGYVINEYWSGAGLWSIDLTTSMYIRIMERNQ